MVWFIRKCYYNINFNSNTQLRFKSVPGLLYLDRHVYCPICNKKFVNRYNLKVHIRDKHETLEILQCMVCGKGMRNQSCLRVHLYHHRKQLMIQQS